jgi:hypothetical protein
MTVRAGMNAPHPFGYGDSHLPPGIYLSFGVQGEAIAHNLFLDGNTFEHGPRVKRTPFVWQKEGAIGFSYGTISLDYRGVVRSREFTGGRRYHPYGTLAFTRRGVF